MSEQKNDGGPAFPELSKLYQNQYSGERSSYLHYKAETSGGMSLRDWFASQADGLSEEASSKFVEQLFGGEAPPSDEVLETMKWWSLADARVRYIQADAMLLARGESQ